MSVPTVRHSELDLSLVVTSLLRGVVEASSSPVVWRHLLGLQADVRDYVAVLGLTLVLDEGEGYAFLRSRPEEEMQAGPPGLPPPPRLVRRHALSFSTSLLLALLRKRLAEFDASTSDTRLVLSRDQIVELVRVFLPSGSNEARVVDQVDTAIGRAVDLGFLRRLSGEGAATYEVRRILKAFVDGQWLSDFDARLRQYADQLAGTIQEEEP